MAIIHKNQTLLTIELETGYDLSNADEVKILWKKPDGTKGEWVATVVESTKVSYILQDDDEIPAGQWQLQAYVEEDNRIGYGGIAYLTVYDNLD